MTYKSSKYVLPAQVSKDDFFQCELFACSNSEREHRTWGAIIRNNGPVSLGLFPSSRTSGSQLTLERQLYCRVQKLTLDNLGLRKLSHLAEQRWTIGHKPDALRATGNPREAFVFEPRDIEYEYCTFGRADFQRARLETDLRSVKSLTIRLNDIECPWTTIDGNCVFLFPVDHPETQRKLACIAKCMPSLERVVVHRAVRKAVLHSQLRCISWRSGRLSDRIALGFAVISQLEAIDRQIERALVNKSVEEQPTLRSRVKQWLHKTL